MRNAHTGNLKYPEIQKIFNECRRRDKPISYLVAFDLRYLASIRVGVPTWHPSWHEVNRLLEAGVVRHYPT